MCGYMILFYVGEHDVSNHFFERSKGVKGCNLNDIDINPYLVIHNLKGLLTRKVNTLRNNF